MAFRELNVGTDVKQYLSDYEIYKSSGMVFSVEPLWYYLNKFVIILGGEFREVLILSSFLILFPIFLVSKKWSYFPMFSIFIYVGLYYYLNSYNAIRQSISISFGIYGVLLYLDNKTFKNYKSILFFIVSFLFHYSSIILPISIFLIKILKNFDRYLLLIVFLSFFSGLFLADFLLILSKKITNYDIELYNIWGNMTVGMVVNLLFLFVRSIIKNKNDLYYLYALYLVLANLLIRIPFGYRFILGLGLIQIIFYPNLIKNNKLDGSSKKILVLLLIIYSVYTFSFYLLINFSEVLPYLNILL